MELGELVCYARCRLPEPVAIRSETTRNMKKPYEKPAIVFSEPLKTRAVACAASDDACAARGPINS